MTVDPLANAGWLYELPEGTFASDVRWRIRTMDGVIVGIGQGNVGRFVMDTRTAGLMVQSTTGPVSMPVNIPGARAHPKADDH
jgi:hypothetical protein